MNTFRSLSPLLALALLMGCAQGEVYYDIDVDMMAQGDPVEYSSIFDSENDDPEQEESVECFQGQNSADAHLVEIHGGSSPAYWVDVSISWDPSTEEISYLTTTLGEGPTNMSSGYGTDGVNEGRPLDELDCELEDGIYPALEGRLICNVLPVSDEFEDTNYAWFDVAWGCAGWRLLT